MIISVWGNNGSGKSTLAIKIALEFANKNKNVILLDTDYVAPQLQVWCPEKDIAIDCSMSNVLQNNVALDVLATKITVINDCFGIIGYSKNEFTINNVSHREDTAAQLLTAANNIADYVIVDCQSNVTQDVLSFVAIDTATVKIIAPTPDLRGISWYQSNVLMFAEKWKNKSDKTIKAFNQVKKHSPVLAAEKAIGKIDYFLPYSEWLQIELFEGKLCNRKGIIKIKNYIDVISSIVTEIDNE